MGKKGSTSKRWLKEHEDDAWVLKARRDGYRSRAVYKLEEIDQRDQLFRPGMVVVDLGAAPGGWCQYATRRVGEQGRVIALDLLPVDPMAGMDFLQGDFTEDGIYEQLQQMLNGEPVDLVISDMAPNMSGMAAIDQPRSLYLCELAADFARQHLKPGGDLLMKVFQGEGYQEFNQALKQQFSRLQTRKPKASRDRSREVYLLARGQLAE